MITFDFIMKTGTIIVGQGISGTFLSWFLLAAGEEFIIIDNSKHNASSRVAAGLINPVTGRRVVKVWMDDVLLPFAEQAYNSIGAYLNVHAMDKKKIIDFFPNPFMKESFLKKLALKEDYITMVDDEHFLKEYFHYEFGSGIIYPGYIVHLSNILPAWKNYLLSNQLLIQENFDTGELNVTKNQVCYKSITAKRIIFCDGADGIHNKYFSLLPFALNKGEALIIEAQGLPDEHIYKKSLMLAPVAEKGYYWVGTNYIWDFEDEQPTEAYINSTEKILKSWLKVPFKIVEHRAAVRPATVERRPFAGFHPVHQNVGILNGMGTKGCSLAPYFAHRLCEHILYKKPLEKEADISRFTRILTTGQ